MRCVAAHSVVGDRSCPDLLVNSGGKGRLWRWNRKSTEDSLIMNGTNHCCCRHRLCCCWIFLQLILQLLINPEVVLLLKKAGAGAPPATCASIQTTGQLTRLKRWWYFSCWHHHGWSASNARALCGIEQILQCWSLSTRVSFNQQSANRAVIVQSVYILLG